MKILRWITVLAIGAALALTAVFISRPGLVDRLNWAARDIMSTAVAAFAPQESNAALSPAAIPFERIEIDDNAGDIKLVGDIDGDGFPDLVLGGMPQEQLNWYRYPNWEKSVIATPGNEFTTDGALGDVDGDGDLDIVVPDGNSGDNLLWFENPRPDGDPAQGDQWTRRVIGAIGSWGKDVELADFDGNGRLDVAARRDTAAMIFFQTDVDAWQQMIFNDVELGNEGMASGDIDGDGHVDIVLRGVWVRNPGGSAARDAANWTQYTIGDADSDFKALVVDLNQDGQMDVLFSSSENRADVNWWTPENGDPTGAWRKQTIVPALEHAHTLQAADMDLDGDIDVVVGQMHTTDAQEIMIMLNVDGLATTWAKQLVATGGLHNGVVADIGNDGDYDIYGANWTGNPPARLWENKLDAAGPLDLWTYKQITAAHAQTFGLAFGDVARTDAAENGLLDIVSGRYWYQNPGHGMLGDWAQFEFPANMHAILVVDVDGDAFSDVIAQADEGELALYWLEAVDTAASDWNSVRIGGVEAASHNLGAQGYATAQIEAGGKPEILISSGNGIYYFRIPAEPAAGNWPRIHVSSNPSDEGFAAGDIDGDGDLDIAATTGDAKGVEWYRNPGDGSAEWTAFAIGAFEEALFPDRTAVADLNGDGRLDIIVTEENGEDADAQTFWWAQPADPTGGNWTRTLITTQATTNSLDAADMDNDGDVDLILAEHRGARKLAIWVNDGQGNFTEKQVDAGKESHLGARAVDLDGDGDLDIVSIAWDDFGQVHLWRNDARRNKTHGGRSNTYVPITPKPQAGAPEPAAATQPAEPASGPLALYTFQSGSGAVIRDVSNQGDPLDLRVADATAVSWLPAGGLAITAPTIISAAAPADKLVSAVQASNAFSLSAWLSSADGNQDGPARIVTLSRDPFLRNFTLGQEFGAYDVRLRTTATSENGIPSLATANGAVDAARTHLVYTRAANGAAQLYLNGAKVAETKIGGDFANWDSSYVFALVNELTLDRPWLGELYAVALYDRALGADEVTRQFQGGVAALLPPEAAAATAAAPLATAQPAANSLAVQALEAEPTTSAAPQAAAPISEPDAVSTPAADTTPEDNPVGLLLGGGALILLVIGLGLIGRQRKRSQAA